MKQKDISLFGTIPEPKSFLELTELVTITGIERRNVRLWRGQADIEWPVHSGAYRRLLINKEKVTEKDLIYYEKNLLKQARHKGYGFNDGTEISDAELLSKLQHHGAATRLVDFSKNFLVALWFCVNTHHEKTGLLLGIHSSYVGGGVEGVLGESSYNEIIDELSKYDYPMFIETPIVSKRIAAQHGVFLYSDICNDETGSLKIPKDKDSALFIAISPDLKKKSRKILIETFDIRNETLFPDLDGFSFSNNITSSTNEMYRW